MESASPLIAESVKIIKHLKNQVAVLESENEKLKSDLANVQKRYHDNISVLCMQSQCKNQMSVSTDIINGCVMT